MSIASTTGAPPDRSHPKGLYVLFTTEMWERFNFYGMRAILGLFIAQALAYGEEQGTIIFGGFLSLCYITPMLGGYISDRYLGNRNCILLGGLLMAIGQLMLFFSATMYASNVDTARMVLYIALLVLVFGNGFFKPNISSMVGSLYKRGDNRLDSAFTIFYLGINIGALLGNFVCAAVGDVKVNEVRDLSAFKWGFLAAGAAMVLATVIFYFLKNKYIVTPEGRAIGARPSFTAHPVGDQAAPVSPKDIATSDGAEKAKFSTGSIITTLAIIVGLTFAFHWFTTDPAASFHNPIKEWLYPFIYAAGLGLAYLIISDSTITKVERDRILVLYIVCFFVIFFWACFEQASSSLTFIADQQTDLHIMGVDIPPSMVQNFNAIFIILFAFPFSWLWIQLGKRDPIAPVKQAIGLLLMAVGYLILSFAVDGLANTAKISILTLGIMYMFHTWGELCLSPIGLSLVAKLSPKRFASLLMGVWFIGNAAGYALMGTLGALLPPTGPKYLETEKLGIDLKGILDKTVVPTADQSAQLAAMKINTVYPQFMGFTIHNLYDFVVMFVVLSAVAGVLLLGLSPMLKRMMHGVR